MGLIRAAMGAGGGVLADQWKEFFYCDALPKDVLVKKGQKKTSSRSSNTRGEENIISNGSGIAVADGQCMIIVEQGKVVEVCAEPGEFTYDASTEPSIFSGSLGESIKQSFKLFGKRFSFGGDTAKDQRVYYFNTKEIMNNMFGTPTPIPFMVVDPAINLHLEISLRCNGTYSYKIVDPLLFYTNVCGNVEEEYLKEEVDPQLKSEFLSALQPAFAKLGGQGLRYSEIPLHTPELCDGLNEILTKKWSELRGIAIVSVGINSVSPTEEDAETIKKLQRGASLGSSSRMAAGVLAEAQADAMRTAAGNQSGAMAGFMGMGMAGGAANVQGLFAAAQQEEQNRSAQPSANSWHCSCGATATGNFCPNCGSKKPEQKPEGGWKCSCGATATGKFCPECGAPKPADGWKCSCGAVNKGKFCMECGKPKPAGEPLYRCDKCGWEPADPKHPPKFCPECGDPFDDSDIK